MADNEQAPESSESVQTDEAASSEAEAVSSSPEVTEAPQESQYRDLVIGEGDLTPFPDFGAEHALGQTVTDPVPDAAPSVPDTPMVYDETARSIRAITTTLHTVNGGNYAISAGTVYVLPSFVADDFIRNGLAEAV